MPEVSAAGRVLGLIDRAAEVTIVGVMAVMLVVVSVQILLRYVFNTSIDWAEDVARLCFVWSIFLAIPLGIKHGAHIAIELLVPHLPEAWQRAFFRVVAILSALMMVIVGYYAALQVIQQWDEMLPTIELSAALFMVPVALGAAHSVLHLAMLTVSGVAPKALAPVE